LQKCGLTIQYLSIFLYNEQIDWSKKGGEIVSERKRNTVSRIHTEFAKQEELREKRLHNKKVSLYRNLAIMGTVFFLTMGTLVFTIINQHQVLKKEQQEQVALKKEKLEQKQYKKELNAQLVKLDDDDYIAKIVRKDLFLSKKGEKIFHLPEDSEDDEGIDLTENEKK